MTDTEWQAIAPLLPWPTWLDGNGGRPEEYCRRLVIDAICYVADNGNKWRNLPVDYGIHWKTLHATFTRWSRDGFTLALHNDLREKVREAEGRDREPSAAIIDSQSVRAAETVGADSRGWDAGKKVGGRKRHVIVDTIGMVLVVLVTAANVQDRDGARPALELLRDLYERVVLVWADGGYAGKLVDWAKDKVHVALEIVKRSDDAKGFVVLPGALGGRAQPVVDLPAPPVRPRLRALTRAPRGHGPLVGDHPDATPCRPRHRPCNPEMISSWTGTYGVVVRGVTRAQHSENVQD
ncbi:IS5 family transposase [Streptomyces sp. NPDC004227]